MIEHTPIRKLQYLVAGMLLVGNLLLATLLLPAGQVSSIELSPAATTTPAPTPKTAAMYDSPNAVANVFAMGADIADDTFSSLDETIGGAAGSVGETFGQMADSLDQTASSGITGLLNAGSSTGSFIARTTHTGMTWTAHTVSSSITFVVQAPANVLDAVADAPVVSSVIKPASTTEVPVIDLTSPVLVAAREELPVAETIEQTAAKVQAATWPLLGDVTTLFGVPHWPYQPTHSGLDISSGAPSGVTPIKPFRAGTVTDTVYSYYGLGNYVVVDHGDGLTSVYAHLSSISVKIGQPVDQKTVLGYEGSTGASTGPHLHLEIRINGEPVDPSPYIGVRPH